MKRNSKTRHLPDDRREVEKIPRTEISTQRAKSNRRKITTNRKGARTRRYVGVKSVQYVKMGLAPKIAAQKESNWDLEQAVRETERNFSTDLQLLRSETTNDPTLFKALVCLERQQNDQIPREYLPHKKKLSSRFRLVFIEDKVIVPKNLRTTIISLLHKGHPAINKMTAAPRHFWWPKMT